MRTTLEIEADIARLTIDDGKVNAMSTEMLVEIRERLEQCRTGARVTVLRGRPGIFSAGFDMPTFSQGLGPTRDMLASGMHAIVSMLTHPHPIVAACTGHAFPMGAFLMMCADVRYGVRGDFKIGMNEVAIGLTVPRFALQLAEHRLTRQGFARVATAELFSPDEAAELGYLDYVVEPAALNAAVDAAATRLLELKPGAYAATKARMHGATAEAIRQLSDPATLEAELQQLANP